MKVTVEPQVGADLADTFYGWYLLASEVSRAQAAMRHVVTLDEFVQEMTDERVDKYVVWDDEARPVGLTTLTTDLRAALWASEDFYTTRFPQQAAAGAIFYLGFTLVPSDPELDSGSVTALIVDAIVQRVQQVGGVCLFDTSAHNADSLGIGAMITDVSRWRSVDGTANSRNSGSARAEGRALRGEH